MNINMDVVMEALGIMGKGMLGIFVVIVIIALLVYALTLYVYLLRKAEYSHTGAGPGPLLFSWTSKI